MKKRGKAIPNEIINGSIAVRGVVNQAGGTIGGERERKQRRNVHVPLLIAWTRSRQIYHSKSSDCKKFRLSPVDW